MSARKPELEMWRGFQFSENTSHFTQFKLQTKIRNQDQIVLMSGSKECFTIIMAAGHMTGTRLVEIIQHSMWLRTSDVS